MGEGVTSLASKEQYVYDGALEIPQWPLQSESCVRWGSQCAMVTKTGGPSSLGSHRCRRLLYIHHFFNYKLLLKNGDCWAWRPLGKGSQRT